MIVLFHRNRKKNNFGNRLKTICYKKRLTTRCQKIGKILTNLGTNCLGDHLSMGSNELGLFVLGDQLSWEPFVHEDQMIWD